MKPGNLAEALRCQIRRRRKMRIRYTHIESFGVRFFLANLRKLPIISGI